MLAAKYCLKFTQAATILRGGGTWCCCCLPAQQARCINLWQQEKNESHCQLRIVRTLTKAQSAGKGFKGGVATDNCALVHVNRLRSHSLVLATCRFSVEVSCRLLFVFFFLWFEADAHIWFYNFGQRRTIKPGHQAGRGHRQTGRPDRPDRPVELRQKDSIWLDWSNWNVCVWFNMTKQWEGDVAGKKSDWESRNGCVTDVYFLPLPHSHPLSCILNAPPA